MYPGGIEEDEIAWLGPDCYVGRRQELAVQSVAVPHALVLLATGPVIPKLEFSSALCHGEVGVERQLRLDLESLKRGPVPVGSIRMRPCLAALEERPRETQEALATADSQTGAAVRPTVVDFHLDEVRGVGVGVEPLLDATPVLIRRAEVDFALGSSRAVEESLTEPADIRSALRSVGVPFQRPKEPMRKYACVVPAEEPAHAQGQT